MTIELELTPDVHARLLALAQSSGLSLEGYLEQMLRERSGITSQPTLARSRLAGQRIRELREGVTLAGISIKELIEEGRE